MTDEPTYTLDEARRVLARRECGAHGHDWTVLQKMTGVPYLVCCGRCGDTYPVGPQPGHSHTRADAAS